jgi:hypothetical protein
MNMATALFAVTLNNFQYWAGLIREKGELVR